ncbi:RluA family pseudouridine synthase [Hansschlegelia zhihuaiae]|uniref:RNA pseudouridine synthase n=1 Tax=Hansschlegelia zhihuaiae TaxID=405005 RepID=A0A4Q0M8Z3_9HYPH|nr:RNA pseudouridine synthase [Hansschlegelia zhihuaiae]RXF69594.1 RNA pseudouridine synthase [Hansschlegelia zhihuaiae]
MPPDGFPDLDLDLVPRVLHRDGLVLVIDKPAGLPVHAGPKGGANLEQLFSQLRFGLPRDPALAHRLDKDTSGCLALGRHRKALAKLGKLFSSGRVGKTYWAVVRGEPQAEGGRIEAALAKRDPARGWWMAVDPAGLPSVTDWRVMARGGGLAWIEFTPLTGRTHQIRAHAAHIGLPLLGDPIYGREPVGGARLHLHARALSLPMKQGADPIAVTAPLPAHISATFAAMGWTAGS